MKRRKETGINAKKDRRCNEDNEERKDRWQSHFYGEDWQRYSEFDLIIHPDQVSIPDACENILTALEQPSYQTTHKSLETIDLLTVAAELRARIAMKADVADDNVQVDVRDGMVVVTGSVRSPEDMEGIRELLD